MATIELGLLRHAHAGDPAKWHGDDFDRPLSGRGRDQAERVGRLLRAADFVPDAIVTSPRIRARETAEIVGDLLDVAITIDERLGEALTLAAVDAILGDLGAVRRPILVGHDPDFSDLLAVLTGAPEIPMRKGAVARIDVDPPIAPGQGILRWLIPPELIADRG